MAIITNGTTGNWSSSATWQVIDPTAFPALTTTQETGSTASTQAYAGSTNSTLVSSITIDAILLKLQVRSTTLGGTLSVRLFNVTAGAAVAGTTVTINVNDMPAPTTNPTWMAFKFAAPISTIAGNGYRVELSTSVGSAATFYRKSATAADWTYGLRTTTNQAPAASDQILICGDYTGPATSNSYTVTYDRTTPLTLGTNITNNAAIEVSAKGTLAWATAATSTYALTLAGNLYINQDGAMTVGTAAVPMPSTSIATITFAVTTNVQYFTYVRGNGALTTYGATKTTKAYLTSNVVAGGTSLQTSVSTGWNSGDILAIASTSRLVAECEQVTMSGAATGTTVPCSALAFNHDGSSASNVAKAEIINLNRNVVFKGVSASLQTSIFAQNQAAVIFGFTEFQFMGSAGTNLRGVDLQQTAGSATITGCSFRNFEVASSIGLNLNSTTPNFAVSNCVFYRCNISAITTLASNTTSTISINDCWAIGGTSQFSDGAFRIASAQGTFTNLNAAGSSSPLSALTFAAAAVVQPFVASNLISHSNSGPNIGILTSSELTTTAAQFTNLLAYRSTAEGLLYSATQNVLVDGLISFGNATRGLTYSLAFDVCTRNITINGEVGYSQPAGIVFANHADNLVIENGTVGTIVAHTTADINDVCPRNQHNLYVRNVTFGSPTLAAGQANYTPKTFAGIARLNGVAGSHRTYYKYGILTSDSAYFQVLSPSVRMTPNSATQKFQGPIKEVAVPSGRAAKVSVWVRKSVIGDGTTYNGNEAQLLVLSYPAGGISADTVIATTTIASNGAFELITGTTAVVTDNVALKFLIQCDGTLGWINVDRWMVELV